MSYYDKENVATTPSKNPDKSINDSSPTPSKRTLRPISPNKQNNGGIGKLSFLQSDNIDDHFEYIHNSNEEIKQSLYDLESNTKQTSLDLGQLIDRSKNNNQNLNRVLESIAKYSEEVTTEGNATKFDVTRILEKLEALSNQDSSEELRLLRESIETNAKENQWTEISTLLKSIKEDNEKSSSRICEDLDKLSISLELQEPSANGTSPELSKEIDALKQTIESQSNVVKDLEKRLALLKSTDELERRHLDLQHKYDILCESYKEKYNQYSRLGEHFKALEQRARQFTDDLQFNDSQKYSNLQQLHSGRLDALAGSDGGSLNLPKKRVVSMPLKEVKEESYNETEEF